MSPPVTYAEFLLAFVVVPLAVLFVFGRSPTPDRRRTAGTGILIVLGLALVYTTPWDNFLIAKEVWWYGEGTVLARLWLAPVEEYVFILLQPLLAAGWLYHLGMPEIFEGRSRRARVGGTAAWLALGGVGALALTQASTFYLGAILAWAAPVIAFQWIVGGHYLWEHRRLVATAIAVPTLYLWAIDRLAIAWGIWVISPEFTTGLTIAGLPIEEAAFFVVTNTLVVQALVLFHWLVEVRLATTPTVEPADIDGVTGDVGR